MQRSLADFRGKTVVLEWTNEGCPYVKKHYTGAMQALQREATGDGVVWLTIISSAPGNAGLCRGRGGARLEGHAHNGAVDPPAAGSDRPGRQAVRRQDHARHAGHRRDGRLIYVGGIDDRPTNKVEDLQGANNFVRAALDDVEGGRPVRTAFATPYGCSVKYRRRPGPDLELRPPAAAAR